MKINKFLTTAAATLGLALSPLAMADEYRIALVVKSLGNGFFEAAYEGAQEAAAELGNVEVIYTGPTSTTAEGQIEVITSLIAQNVDAIAVSANDADALVPILRRAQQRGIEVISWDSGVAVEGRSIHLSPSNDQLIGEMNITLAAQSLRQTGAESGQFAIMSATPTSTNQNIWIEEMEKVLPNFPELELVDIVYGDDLADKSYRETQALLSNYPDLKVIVAPTTVGFLAAAQAVRDEGRIGEVYVTGLGLPSELAGHVDAGTVHSFAIWNPIDLGYAATHIAYDLLNGSATNEEVSMGRLGTGRVDHEGNVAMAEPFIYDASNVHDFADIF
ncbi:rhamnose ABC transporter substrate-binding protein [Natronospirillum operosum]|uniref:Rhamnose ABC transporter substrate-binding protein n=1 Tax=Natronospirillum operosum TaxID=2759953 RepID=A0A4Z0WAU5_9GAMM|nr:rhamnose ABC transporter substrate-binding protein [Natronospirillum operosum]TGG93485.1 rhamnose ABC transporter substrate-binding protein [Natronospirillum operosum]